jgi:hypothetical protein
MEQIIVATERILERVLGVMAAAPAIVIVAERLWVPGQPFNLQIKIILVSAVVLLVLGVLAFLGVKLAAFVIALGAASLGMAELLATVFYLPWSALVFALPVVIVQVVPPIGLIGLYGVQLLRWVRARRRSV